LKTSNYYVSKKKDRGRQW